MRRSFVVGLLVGMTATCFNAPFDVVKSRFQVGRDWLAGWGQLPFRPCLGTQLIRTGGDCTLPSCTRRCLQSQLPHERRYHTTWGTLATIYKEEGPQALYRGFLPKAIRLGVGQTIGLIVFKQMLKLTGAHETATQTKS